MKIQGLKEFKTEGYIDAIKGIMEVNNGYVTSKQITELGIHRMYLNIMQKNNIIERVCKGIYISKEKLDDVYYTFQLKYPKTIYSRFTALYFYNLTELYPNSFDLTVDYNYHVDKINKEHFVIRCKKEVLHLGLTKVKTPAGNLVNVYDRERCICDIIRFKNKLDLEQVKKSVKMYLKDKNRNFDKLIEYATILNIYNEVMEFVGMYYE